MKRAARIFVAGHRGLLGRALVSELRERGYPNLILAERAECDLLRRSEVERLFRAERPDYVFLAAARVGGIAANLAQPVEFIQENLAIQSHVLEAAQRWGSQGLVLFASSCMYPRDCRQPMREEDLWSGPLEPSSRAYATAKLAGVELCRAYRRQYGVRFFAMLPATLYGPHDCFDDDAGHVIPGLMRRLQQAVEQGEPVARVFGSGRPRREFLHASDAARAALYLMALECELDVVNVGWGQDLSVLELARLLAEISGFEGELELDPTRPDGAPQKRLDVSRMRELGFQPLLELRRGLAETYQWFKENKPSPTYS